MHHILSRHKECNSGDNGGNDGGGLPASHWLLSNTKWAITYRAFGSMTSIAIHEGDLGPRLSSCNDQLYASISTLGLWNAASGTARVGDIVSGTIHITDINSFFYVPSCPVLSQLSFNHLSSHSS
jgi:hypothetical protein